MPALIGAVASNGKLLRSIRAVIIGTLLVLTAAHVRASGAGVNVRILGGGITCWAVPTVDGSYTARHCVEHGLAVFDGSRVVPPYSLDPSRDLAHIAGGAVPSTVLRDPVLGEALTAHYPGGEASRYAYQRIVDGRVYTAERTPGEYLLCCWIDGRAPARGMSGSGFVGDDGALVGIMTNGGWIPTTICASGYAALAVAVP